MIHSFFGSKTAIFLQILTQYLLDNQLVGDY
jgi:hypothetical protein